MDWDWGLIGLYAAAFGCLVMIIIGVYLSLIGGSGMRDLIKQELANKKIKKKNSSLQERPI